MVDDSRAGGRIGVVRTVHPQAQYVRIGPVEWSGHVLQRARRVEYQHIRAVYVRIAP